MQTLKAKITIVLALAMMMFVMAAPLSALAGSLSKGDPCNGGFDCVNSICQKDNGQCIYDKCSSTSNPNGTVNQSKVQSCVTNNKIVSRIQSIVDFLGAGVAIIVTGMIIVGGIQYTIAGDNPQALTAARKRIIDGLIALVAFLFMFGFLQWLIPGGIFQ
jgi:hypothetical protein